MKIIQKIISTSLIVFTINSFAASQETASTRVYNDVAIQSTSNQIIILKSQFEHNPVQNNLFKVPKIGNPIWTITASDLHVTEDTCLEIDALLCRDYKEIFNSSDAKCYDTCISQGLEFVAYDEKAKILYLDAATNVSGTAGTPRFLFAADINKKQIRYLNTFVGPYTGHLSPNGKYLAIEDGWNEISVCTTQTGSYVEIREKNTHALTVIKWLNNEELEYEVQPHEKSPSGNMARIKKIFNVTAKK